MRKTLRANEAFQEAKPVIMTSLVNKIGSIGLALIPILMVSRHYSDQSASFILSGMKIMLLTSALASSVLIARLGARRVILAALFISSLTLFGIPFAKNLYLFGFLAIVCQFADGLIKVPLRILISQMVQVKNQKEALGWLRTVVNFGQVLSFGLGMIPAKIGMLFLFLFDSASSFGAFWVGKKTLPPDTKKFHQSPTTEGKGKSLILFIWITLNCFMNTFLFELYLGGVSGRLEFLHPGQGLRQFSLCMFFNTVACTLFSVKSSNYFKRPSRVLPLSVLVMFVGVFLGTYYTDSMPLVFLSALLVTGSELAYMALIQFAMIQLLPENPKSNTWYASGVTFTLIGRVVAAALVFPCFVQSKISPLIYIGIGVASVLASLPLVFNHEKIDTHSS